MTKERLSVALSILQWALGLVILAESLRFAFSSEAAAVFVHTGLPNFIHLALAWAEIGAAVLFLVPRATATGGFVLMMVLAFAIVVHLLHGWWDVGALVVYAAATWTVVTGKRALSS